MRILIVEDESSWQEILRDYVGIAVRGINASEEGIYVLGTYSEARSAIERNGPWDLIIADITLDASRQVLGKSHGQVIVALAHERKIPTIVVSGTISVSDASNILRRYGVIDCFSKEDFAAFESTFIDDVKKTLSTAKASIVDSFNRSSTSEILLPDTATDLSNGYALLIGIGNYTGIRKLNKTTIDAKHMHFALLENGYLDKNTCLLLDHQATKTEINNALNWLAKSTKLEDTVVIFFSGHGVQRLGGFNPGEYLCPVDTQISNLEDSCISSAEFTNALQSIKAGRLAVFLDACHSGGVGEPKNIGANIRAGLSEATYAYFAKEDSIDKQGRVIIASCRADEVSWELPEMNNGLFTHYLLQGIRGEAARLDGKIPIMRLFEYVSDKVPQHCEQHPFMRAASENFIIARTNLT